MSFSQNEIDVFEKLYKARINVPRAVQELGRANSEKEWEKMKRDFKSYLDLRVKRP